jgi:hypothetical protein
MEGSSRQHHRGCGAAAAQRTAWPPLPWWALFVLDLAGHLRGRRALPLFLGLPVVRRSIYGMCLQYGRFCMASAIRDLFAVGVPRMAVGIMIAVVLFSLVSAAVTLTGKQRLPRLAHRPVFRHRRRHLRLRHDLHRRLRVGLAVQERRGQRGRPAGGVLTELRAGDLRRHRRRGECSSCRRRGPPRPRPRPCPRPSRPTHGWYDQFLAGYIWDLKATPWRALLGIGRPQCRGCLHRQCLAQRDPAGAS